MEIELEPRVKPLPYKIKGMSRESPSQKATHVLDTDLRNHWSTGTNTKEWILLEVDEPGLLSHIRIYNKSVLEWEIAVGLRYKPETFVKVRPRCEAPRRDMIYPMNYTPCRYVRISCLRGNPIAIFFIQLIGVSVSGLEPEFQPVVNHLLPHILSHKQDAHDMHLQLLQDMTNRLAVFLPQLEPDLNSFSDAADPNIRFLAMLAGPFYPILHIVNERETARLAGNVLDSEASKNSQSSSGLTVSSNFEPRRSRSTLSFFVPTSSSMVFRPDGVFMLLRKAYKDPQLGTVCRIASRILLKLIEPITVKEASMSSSDAMSSKTELSNGVLFVDYSSLFGEEFQIPDDHWESNYINILDIAAVEEGILHVLYACASQPLLCSKLAESTSDFWSALPLVQALLPALRPSISSPDNLDESFSQWKQPFVHDALSQIVATSSSSVYRPLLHACAGYLSSFSPSHAKAACVLVDLCSGVLAAWMGQVIAKVDLTVELLEDLLGVIQGARHSLTRARAALKYIILALSGNMDDVMSKYKEVKHQILFLVEMLEPFLDPAMTPIKSMIAFGNVSSVFQEKQEQSCAIALNVIRTAVKKPAVLPSLESEWRRGSVDPSVLLSILEPHMQLPPDMIFCEFPLSEPMEQEQLNALPTSSVPRYGGVTSKLYTQDDVDVKNDISDTCGKMDIPEDVSLFFAPPELRSMSLTIISGSPNRKSSDSNRGNSNTEEKDVAVSNNGLVLDSDYAAEYSNLQADYLQLMNHRDCELRASEFKRLALDLHSQHDITPEGHDAAIDALLLAAECYVNPFFMMSGRDASKVVNTANVNSTKISGKISGKCEFADLRRNLEKKNNDLEMVAYLERKRDTVVLQILLEAAELDRHYQKTVSNVEHCSSCAEENEVVILSQHDVMSADAVTLVRQNQELLSNFLIQRLQSEQHSMHEILMQSLLFLLHSATKLFCPTELVIDIILGSAEYLNRMLTSFYYQFKEGRLQLDPGRVHEVQRRWMLLQRLVVASSGVDEELDFSININSGFRFANLIPPSAWMQKITSFSSSTYPLVRFLGWMAISRNAKLYLKERLFLASNLSQLMYLLTIFSDELARVDTIVEKKDKNNKIKQTEVKKGAIPDKDLELTGQQYGDQSFRVMYPDICQFFPKMKERFEAFGEIILEAVGLHLRSLSAGIVPDLLCWFSDLCSWPFHQKENNQLSTHNNADYCKGFVARNAKAIILYILEAIVTEHMEAMVPEIPRVIQVLMSLCRTSYCDVSFLDSILHLLKPIISYSLHKVSDEEKVLADNSCLNFESLCFDELFNNIIHGSNNDNRPEEKVYSRALTIFVLASVFPDLSFQRKREILQSLTFWAEFANFEPTTSFHDYLSAFQTVVGNCKVLLVETSRVFGIIPLNLRLFSDVSTDASCVNSSESHSWFLNDICYSSLPTKVSEKEKNSDNSDVVSNHKVCHLSIEEIEKFTKDLEGLISMLNPTIELCWSVHHQLSKNLTITSAHCFTFARCLSSVVQKISNSGGAENDNLLTSNSVDQFPDHWRIALEELAKMIVVLQESHCWEVASTMLDCLLGVPQCFCLDNVISTICSAIKKFSCSAPKIAWRLQTDKWLSLLFARGIHSIYESEIHLVDLLYAMLGHPEPEQRAIALQHLSKLVGQDVSAGTDLLSSTSQDKLFTRPDPAISVSELILSPLVRSTWDRVAVLASSDASLLLRIRAMALLVNYVPFADRHQLQSLLAAADSILYGLGKTCECPLTLLSLALIVSVCFYSPAEDISLIPQNAWRNIELLGISYTESRPMDLEKKACNALCRLKSEGDEAKEFLKEVLSSSSSKQMDPDFSCTRESILQILPNLTSVQSYFDFFSQKISQKDTEVEEAEIEMDLLQKEQALQESSHDLKEWHRIPFLAAYSKDDNRLQQIKDGIRSLEKSKLKEEIVARRQKKLLLRCARQKYLEEASLREADLIQELDRERTTEAEREIERQHLLELERAKTQELRYNLEMEKEKQTQRELQRELELVESGGLRTSRREFSSSTHSSRPRERFRERENGRAGSEGSVRTSIGGLQSETATTNSSMTSMPTVVLSGSRPFLGQLPTILQSRDRADESGSSYEENFDGSKDSGDTGSVGDPELVSTFEGQSGGFGSAQRHGSRGSKSRQIVERRERDGRREGKWERKHS